MSGLDNWITGQYGADAPLDPPEIEQDEGALMLQSAMKYLKPRADADEDKQLIGDYEAYTILNLALERIGQDYECRFCGAPLKRRRDQYCSRNCARADSEGL